MAIQIKRGTASAISKANPTLLAGQPCVELDTGMMKVGDGSKSYNSLPYVHGNLASLGVTASATELNYVKGVTSSIQSQLDNKAASSHTHSQYYDSSVSRNKNTVLAAPNGSNGAATFRALVAADIPALTKSKISDFPSSMPASDVYSWAKASTKPSYSKSEVGLGNVDNTADANKSVKYATSAGSASSATKATNIDDGVIS